MSSLAEALAAVRTRDYATARDALIAAWRVRRAPELAELVDLIAAKAPDELTAQIAAIVTPRATSSLDNLRALAAVDDPRLAGFAIDALVQLPFTSATSKEVLVELARTAARHRDPRLVARADAIRVAATTRLGKLAVRTPLLAAVKAALSHVDAVAPPSAADAAILRELAELVEPLRKSSRSATALLAEIYANPADDAPRLVYADALAAQDDPRGELIVLQVARAQRGEDEPSARELELLKKHGKAWLGVLAPVLSWGKGYARTTFRRGFVSNADVILSVGKKLLPVVRDPAWSTVETIEGLYGDDQRVFEHAPLHALRELELDPQRLSQLAARPVKLTSVTRVMVMAPFDAATLYAALPRLHTVTSYWMRPELDELALYATCGAPHLEMFHGVALDLNAARTHVERFAQQLIGRPAPFERLTIHFKPRHQAHLLAPIVLHRDANGNYAS